MKKMMMLAVMGLLGTAGAAGGATAPLKFAATVVNLCQVVATPVTATSTGISLAGNPSVPPITVGAPIAYDATKTTGLSVSRSLSDIGLRIQCTKGTELKVKLTPQGGAIVPAQTADGASENALMKLDREGGGGTLTGMYTFNVTMNNSATAGDVYDGTASYKIDPNQWNAPAGNYEGTLLVELSYI